MAWAEAALLVAAIGLSVSLALRVWRQDRAITGLADDLRRSGALLLELRQRIEQQRRLAEAQQLTESAVDLTTEAVRKIHFGIASIPFSVLEAVPVTRDTTRVVRQTHDLIANAVYGTIRGVNRITGMATRGVLGMETPAQDTQKIKGPEDTP